MQKQPTISVILPVFNEARIIKSVLQTLLEQEHSDFDIEILVIDGMSTDESYKIIQELADDNPSIRPFQNTMRKTPYAFNIGLKEAAGEYVAILGAHCKYQTNYLAVCLGELQKYSAVGCSGKVYAKPSSNSLQARLAMWVLSHHFGVSGSSFRTQPEGYVDTIPYPVFRKEILLELGGYDESFTRNQDNDMNYRLREAGYLLYCTWQTSCEYYTRASLRGLIDYAYGNGSWCAVSFRSAPQSLGLRHYVPSIFFMNVLLSLVACLIGLVVGVSSGWLVILSIPIWLHLLLGNLVSLRIMCRDKAPAALFLAPLFFVFHMMYGYGFLRQLLGIILSMLPLRGFRVQAEL